MQISQSPRRPIGVLTNQSLKFTEFESSFDYTKYKDFFSVIAPDVDFENNFNNGQEVTRTPHLSEANDMQFSLHSDSSSIFSGQNDLPKKPNIQLAARNVSVFSSQSEVHDKLPKDTIETTTTKTVAVKSDKIGKSENTSNKSKNVIKLKAPTTESTKNQNADKDSSKRSEFNPFHLSGILEFFSNIQQSLTTNTVTSIQEKTTLLENMKNTLQENIGWCSTHMIIVICRLDCNK